MHARVIFCGVGGLLETLAEVNYTGPFTHG